MLCHFNIDYLHITMLYYYDYNSYNLFQMNKGVVLPFHLSNLNKVIIIQIVAIQIQLRFPLSKFALRCPSVSLL